MGKIRANTHKGNWGKIENSGQGGFLNPPGHPEHSFCVHSVYGDTFWLSLSTAAYDSDWLNCETIGKARGILKRWERNKKPLNEIQDWIYKIMGYFNTCYTPNNKDRNVSNCLIKKKWNPLKHQGRHLGVLHIRQYYPEFQLEQKHLDNAKWGK